MTLYSQYLHNTTRSRSFDGVSTVVGQPGLSPRLCPRESGSNPPRRERPVEVAGADWERKPIRKLAPKRPLWGHGGYPAYYAACGIRDAMAVPRRGYRGRISTLNRTGWYSTGAFVSRSACAPVW